jgi:rhodanese-related sulfurtransferase
LKDIGVDAARIFTLKGGYEGWTKDDTLGEYQYLLDVVAMAAKTNKPNTFTTDLFAVPRKSDRYFTPEELKNLIEKKEISNYYVIDTRTKSEYESGHIATAISAPDFVDANKGDFTPRTEVIKNVKAAFAKYPYEKGKKIILICRGGKGGAQNMDDVLREEFHIDNDLLYTLKYGYKAFPESWSKLGADYMKYVVKGSEPGVADTK